MAYWPWYIHMMNSGELISAMDKRFEHHSNILMEKMDSTVRVVTEQYRTLSGKVDALGADVNVLKEDMAVVKLAVTAHTKTLAAHSRDIKDIKSDMHFIKAAVVDLGREARFR